MSKTNNLEYYMSLPYTIEITKRTDDGIYFFARVQELQGCMSHGDTFDEAYEMIQDAMKSWIETAIEHGDNIPVPEVEDENKYSGKFIIRTSKSLHKNLANEAKKEGVSLNLYINELLAGNHAKRVLKK